MKLINGWRISVNYDGEPLRDMYAKRFSIYLFKDREYIPCEAEIEKEKGKTYVPLMTDVMVTRVK